MPKRLRVLAGAQLDAHELLVSSEKLLPTVAAEMGRRVLQCA